METTLPAVLDVQPLTPTRKRRITLDDVDEIAGLLAQRFTEKEACEVTGINYDTWRKFKVRAHGNSHFENSLTRAKAFYIKARLDNIQRFEAKDWRASDRLLQIIAPERYSPSAKHEVQVQTPDHIEILLRAVDRVFAKPPVLEASKT